MGSPLHEPLARLVVQATAVVGLSRLLGLAARRVRQPIVIAEIVAGIALGPSLLGRLAPDLEQALFPAESRGLLGVLAQLGLLLFMFLVGLELDAKLLRGKPRAAALLGHASLLVPFALGALLSLHLHPRLAPASVPFWSFTLFMGAATSVTSFPVLARILAERHLLRTRVGEVTIARTGIDAAVVWSALAVLVAAVRSPDLASAARASASALALVAGMFLVVRPLLRRLAGRTATRGGLRQPVVAALLTGLLLASWLTDLAGVDPLFGAFAFGVVVPKEGGFARALAERLEDLVVLLFLPLFFLHSGLRTDLALLDTRGAWATCLLLVAVATAGKLAGSAVAARSSGLSWRESAAVGILMNTRGVLGLVAIHLGLDLGLLSPKLFTMLVIVALVTTSLTSPALSWAVPPTELPKDIDGGTRAPRSVGGYTVLACVAFERSGPAMATLGAALLGRDARNRFYALRLVPPMERASFVLDQQHAPDDGAVLRPLVERAQQLELEVRPLSFISTQPARDICNVAGVKRASLVLLGWNKPLLGNAALGGTVHEVMRRAMADVGVLVDRGLGRIEKILVPYLGSTHDRAALAVARRIVQHTGATATVLHVVSPSRNEKLGVGQKVEEVFQEKTRGLSAQVVFKVVEHVSPVTAVLEESENDYDLVVIGVGPEWGLEHRPFGMQAEVILAKCPTSLLVLRKADPAAARRPPTDEEPSSA